MKIDYQFVGGDDGDAYISIYRELDDGVKIELVRVLRSGNVIEDLKLTCLIIGAQALIIAAKECSVIWNAKTTDTESLLLAMERLDDAINVCEGGCLD